MEKWLWTVILIVLVFLFGVVVGLGVTGAQVYAQGPRNIHYEVIGASRDTTLERELNEQARQGCRPILTTGSGYSEAMIILECPN